MRLLGSSFTLSSHLTTLTTSLEFFILSRQTVVYIGQRSERIFFFSRKNATSKKKEGEKKISRKQQKKLPMA
jgi:hypothetical protein